MRNPRAFLRPLAVGAPAPLSEVPFRPSRMIHFFDPSNEKMAAKVPDIAKKVDIILGNLEDAIKTEKKEAARQGLVDIAKATDFGDTQLWVRVNSLDSPWVLDDLTTLVTEIGDKLDVKGRAQEAVAEADKGRIAILVGAAVAAVVGIVLLRRG